MEVPRDAEANTPVEIIYSMSCTMHTRRSESESESGLRECQCVIAPRGWTGFRALDAVREEERGFARVECPRAESVCTYSTYPPPTKPECDRSGQTASSHASTHSFPQLDGTVTNPARSDTSYNHHQRAFGMRRGMGGVCIIQVVREPGPTRPVISRQRGMCLDRS